MAQSATLDNMQNAVMKAADNVSEMVAETTAMADLEHHSYEVFYHNPEFWVGFAFILVVVFLAKPVGKAGKNWLLKRQQGIIDKINEGEQLQLDAQQLLADYERKYLSAKKEAAEILQNSQREIELLKNQELHKLEDNLNIRRKEVESSIHAAIDLARNEINKTVAALASQMVKEHIKNSVDSKKQSALVDQSIERILNRMKNR